jgi:hypothetical protein
VKEENSRLVLEIQDLKNQLAVEKVDSSRHSQAAAVLARERTWLASKMAAMDELVTELESNLLEEQRKTKLLACELSQASFGKLARYIYALVD